MVFLGYFTVLLKDLFFRKSDTQLRDFHVMVIHEMHILELLRISATSSIASSDVKAQN